MNGLIYTIATTAILEINSINKLDFLTSSNEIFFFFKPNIRIVDPNTKDKLAMLEPTTFPTTIAPRFSRAAKKLVSISGEEVPNAITVDPIRKGEILSLLALNIEYLSNFSLLIHINKIPKEIKIREVIILFLFNFLTLTLLKLDIFN